MTAEKIQFKGLRRVMIVLVLFAVFCSGWVYYVRHSPQPRGVVTIGGERFEVEMAQTDEERSRGLGGRDFLCSHCGMLFVFDMPGRYGFWMKDMRFPVDILWIRDGRVVFVAYAVAPEREDVLQPWMEADQVLEIPAGTAKELGVEEGSLVDIGQ